MLVFAACKKSDNKSGNASIVGTWKPATQITKTTVNGTLSSIDTSISDANEWVMFTAGGQVYSHTLSDKAHWEDDTSSYTVNGSLMNIIDGTDTTKMNILTLTNNSLVLKSTETDIWAGDTTIEEFTSTFSR